jgi:hypothetical protein
MAIPFVSLDLRPAVEGSQFRINLYRIQGRPPDRTYIAWQPTGARSHHVPEAFGRLMLGK